MTEQDAPGLALYRALQTAFDHFNHTLFAGELPPCVLTLRAARTRYGHHQPARFSGASDERLDEIALNPGYFALRPLDEVLSTLVHEMVHHWQENLGKPTRSNHHNGEWAAKMQEVGLMPSNTGAPGGDTGGNRVSHYIIEGGAFQGACRALLAQGFKLPVYDRHAPEAPQAVLARVEARFDPVAPPPPDGMNDIAPWTPPPPPAAPEAQAPLAAAEAEGRALSIVAPPPPRPSNRQRLVCPGCQASAWISRGDVALICARCALPLEPV